MAVPRKLVLYVKNDQMLSLDGLTDSDTGSYVNAAVVTATLYKRDGSIVPEINGLVLDYVVGSNGKYAGQVNDTFSPTAGGGYTLHIDAVFGATKLHIEIPVEVKVRKS